MTDIQVTVLQQDIEVDLDTGTGPQGVKGDPGGNVMAIGLFTATGILTLGAGVEMVRTSGHYQVGRGAAFYVKDAAVNGAYVTANPYSSFITLDGYGYRLDTGQEIDVDMLGARGDAVVVGTVYAGTEDTARINAALNLSEVYRVKLGPRGYMVDTMSEGCVRVPAGKTLYGCSRAASWLYKKPLPGAATQAEAVSVVAVAAAGASSITLHDFSVDAQASGFGRSASQRCNGVMLAVHRRCSVQRVDAFNTTAYGHWANGEEAAGDNQDASVHYQDCYVENCQVSFEHIGCDYVKLDRCEAVTGPQSGNICPTTIDNEAHFHCYGECAGITYNDCQGSGDSGSTILPSLSFGDIERLTINGGRFVNTLSTASALIVAGPGSAIRGIRITNAEFVADGNAVSISYTEEVSASNCRFSGAPIGVGLNEVDHAYFSECIGIGTATSPQNSWGLYVDASCTDIQWHGGSLRAEGTGASAAWTGNAKVSLVTHSSPAFAVDFVDDAAAAAGGIAIGGEYRNGSVKMVRVS